jgi:hypothetical protein
MAKTIVKVGKSDFSILNAKTIVVFTKRKVLLELLKRTGVQSA